MLSTTYRTRFDDYSATQSVVCFAKSLNLQYFFIEIIGINVNTLTPEYQFMRNFAYTRLNFADFKYSQSFHVPVLSRLTFSPLNPLASVNTIKYEIQHLDNFDVVEAYEGMVITQFQIRVLYHAQYVCRYNEYYFNQTKTCYSSCPLATFNYLNFCIGCIPNCKICVSRDACITCQEGFDNLDFGCVECPPNCRVCSTNNRCISCKDGYYLEESCKSKVIDLPQFKVTMDQNKQLLISLLSAVAQPEALLSKIDIICRQCRIHTIIRTITGSQLKVQAVADQAQQRLTISSLALIKTQYEFQQKKVQFQARLPMKFLQTRAQCQQSLNKPELISCKVELLNNKFISAPSTVQIKIAGQMRNAQLFTDDSSFTFEFRAGMGQCRNCLVQIQLNNDLVLKEFMFTRAIQCMTDFVALGDTSSKFVIMLNSASRQILNFFNIMLAVMNLLGLLQSVEQIFLSVSSIKITTRFVSQTPITYRPFPLALTAIQNLLLPDIITNNLNIHFNHILSQSTLWLIAYLLPIFTASIFHLFITRLVSFFALAKRIFKPKLALSLQQTLQTGNLFSRGAVSFAWEQSKQKILVVNFASCWLFYSFMFLKKGKKFSRLKILCTCDFLFSYLLGAVSILVYELAHLACVSSLILIFRIYIGYKFKQKPIHLLCIGFQICINICLLIQKFQFLSVSEVLGFLIIGFYSAIVIINVGNIVKMTYKKISIILRRYRHIVQQDSRNQIKMKQRKNGMVASYLQPISRYVKTNQPFRISCL